jgi:hypothetical protein
VTESKNQSIGNSSQTDDASAAARGPLAFLVVGVGAVLLLGGLTLFGKGPEPVLPLKEIPQLALLVELKDTSPDSRNALATLQKGLLQLPGVRVRGPMDCPLLLWDGASASGPGPRPPVEAIPPEVRVKVQASPEGTEPSSKMRLPGYERFHVADPAKFEEAALYFECGGYLAPRMLSPDGKSAIFRVSPAAGHASFSGGTLKAVQDLLEAQKSAFEGASVYSKSLKQTDPAAAKRINETFGVETLWVVLESSVEGTLLKGDVLRKIEEGIATLNDARILSVASDAQYCRYAHAVYSREAGDLTPLDSPDVHSVLPGLIFLAKQAGYPLLTTEDAKRTFIEITTSAEGKAAFELEKACALKFGSIPGVRAFPNRHTASQKP